MLGKFLNKNVFISALGQFYTRGIVTRVENDFIELDYKGKNQIVAIKYIIAIREL